jgi:chromosome segregation ATPase
MLFSLGFLIATLGAVAISPAFWHRAVRLSTRRLEMQLPLSAREVLAGRDLLRAELAVEHRKLEQKVEALGAIHAQDMAELGRRAVTIAERDAELETFRTRFSALETESAELARALTDTEATLDTRSRAVDETAAALHDATARSEQKSAEVRNLEHQLAILHKLSTSQRSALTTLEQDLLDERKSRTLESVRVARLDDELSALQREHDIALARLKRAESEIETLERRLLEAEGQGAAGRSVAATGHQEVATPESAVTKDVSLGADEDLRREIESLYEDLLAYHDKISFPSGSGSGSETKARSRSDERTSLRGRISAIGSKVAGMAELGATPTETASDHRAPIAAAEPKT